MRYRLITAERIWNDGIKDYNICLQQKRWFGWQIIDEYRPYQFERAVKRLDALRK